MTLSRLQLVKHITSLICSTWVVSRCKNNPKAKLSRGAQKKSLEFPFDMPAINISYETFSSPHIDISGVWDYFRG